MTTNAFPHRPGVELWLDGERLGMVQEFSEEKTVQLTEVTALGTDTAAAFVPRKVTYRVQFKRLVPDPARVDPGGRLQQTQGFTLEFLLGDRNIRFTGCEFTRLAITATAAGSLVEAAELMALGRSEGQVGA